MPSCAKKARFRAARSPGPVCKWRTQINPRMSQHITIRVVTAAAFLSLPLSVFPQGSLTPPGPPAPTMKKLDEVEPRTNLQASPAPAGVDTSNANYQSVINQPGSYYLAANLLVTKTNGIQINAEGVTLDLNGFQVSRDSASGKGIEITSSSDHVTVRNGTVKGFARGIDSGSKACAVRDLTG